MPSKDTLQEVYISKNVMTLLYITTLSMIIFLRVNLNIYISSNVIAVILSIILLISIYKTIKRNIL